MIVQTPAAPPAAPAPPAPGSPEYATAMAAAYDAQFPAPTQKPTAALAPAAPVTGDPSAAEPPKEPAAPEPPKEPEAPKGDAEPPKDPKEPEAPKNLGALFEDGTFASGFSAEALPPELATALKATGLPDSAVQELHAEYRAGRAAIAELATQKVHALAGGKEAFEQITRWAGANLNADQQAFYNDQLNGPMAAEALAVLKQRAMAGTDPRLAQVNASANPPVTGFRDSTEMQIAMGDARYKTSEAYRREVAQKLRHSTF